MRGEVGPWETQEVGLYVYVVTTEKGWKKKTFNELKGLEREPLKYWKGDGKVTFTRPFLMLGNVTFDTQVYIFLGMVLKRRYITHIYKTLIPKVNE